METGCQCWCMIRQKHPNFAEFPGSLHAAPKRTKWLSLFTWTLVFAFTLKASNRALNPVSYASCAGREGQGAAGGCNQDPGNSREHFSRQSPWTKLASCYFVRFCSGLILAGCWIRLKSDSTARQGSWNECSGMRLPYCYHIH